MPINTHTLTLPIHPIRAGQPQTDWSAEAAAFTQALGPRRGVQKIDLNHDAGTLTVHYDPLYFSVEQLKALGHDLGLAVEGAVYHTILDLPQCARRAAMAQELERRLQTLDGVTYASVNPSARTMLVEYVNAPPPGLAGVLETWGYQLRAWGHPESWWTRNQQLVYTALTVLFLVPAWFAQRAHAPLWLWGGLVALGYLAGGGLATLEALRALRHGKIEIDFLMVSAAVGAAISSDWAEGGVLLFLFSLSNALQTYAMDRTRQAIRALMALRPATARVRRGSRELEVPVEALVVGDLVTVRPGERLPADGVVTAGQSAVDQSPITGESIPVSRSVDEPVFAGSINGGGALTVRVGKPAADSTLARVIRLVEEAQSERAPTQRLLDDLEQGYATGVILLAAGVALSLPLLFGWVWEDALHKAMVLLVVASPCALVISTPASILSAIAAGARHGVLFKGGAHVEQLAAVRVVAFDKTGTLTVGKPRLTDLFTNTGRAEDDFLRLAAAVEARSEHPLAHSVLEAARERRLSWPEASDLQATPGKGVSALVEGQTAYLGTEVYMRELGLTLPDDWRARADALAAQGKTVMWVAQAGALAGLLAVSDTVRPEARATVAALKAAGVEKVIMLTGDREASARAIGALAGVDEVRAELLPEDKVTAIKDLLAQYGKVAMVGDGVNDAPALALATVGIAMGAGGSDVALETADVVLMSSDLAKLPYAIGLSRQGVRIVRQNLAFALAVVLTLVISAFFDLVPLPLGVVGHEGSTVLVVLNGLRLLGYRPRKPRA